MQCLYLFVFFYNFFKAKIANFTAQFSRLKMNYLLRHERLCLCLLSSVSLPNALLHFSHQILPRCLAMCLPSASLLDITLLQIWQVVAPKWNCKCWKQVERRLYDFWHTTQMKRPLLSIIWSDCTLRGVQAVTVVMNGPSANNTKWPFKCRNLINFPMIGIFKEFIFII